MEGSEQSYFEVAPRETTILDVCNEAFTMASENKDGFRLTTSVDPLGLVREELEYTVPYGTGKGVRVNASRPALDTAEFAKLAEGSVDEKPQAEIRVHAPRSYTFDLANGEKYYAGVGYFCVMVLSDGPYMDINSIAFSSYEDAGVVRTATATVGSMLRPIPEKTDWVIQDIISPSQA